MDQDRRGHQRRQLGRPGREQAGELIGIPTRAREDVGGYSWVRPTPWSSRSSTRPCGLGGRSTARSRRQDGPREHTVETGPTTNRLPGKDRLTSYPSGTTNIVASLDHQGFATTRTSSASGGSTVRSSTAAGIVSQGAESGGCYFSQLYYDRGLPRDLSARGVRRADVRAIATAQTTIGPSTRPRRRPLRVTWWMRTAADRSREPSSTS